MTLPCCTNHPCYDCVSKERDDLDVLIRGVYTTLHASRSGWAQRICRAIAARYKNVTGEKIKFHTVEEEK